MCGLAGIARAPDAPSLDVPKLMLNELIQAMEKRGRHATGVAACGGSHPFIWKWAMPAGVVLKSPRWGEVLDAVAEDTRAIIGHTRHSTHDNSAKDEAAHPFQEGRVVGAHNGIIYNWREIEKKIGKPEGSAPWIVDSQAAFGALNRYKDPATALGMLEGYYALTWWKGGRLFFARSNDAPLVACYVPVLRTMVWASEEHAVRSVMSQAGIKAKEFDLWRPAGGTIYEFDTSRFDARGTHPTRTQFSLKKAEKVKIHAAHRGNLGDPTRGGSKGRGGGKAQQEIFTGQYGDSWWDSKNAREVFADSSKALAPVERRSSQVSLLDMQGSLRRVLGRVEELERLTEKLEDDIATLKLENGHLYDTLDAHGLMSVWEDEDEDEVDVRGKPDSCQECGGSRGEAGKGSLLQLPGGGHVHEKCVFPENKIAAVVTA